MFDDELTSRLARLGAEIESATALPSAATVRTRGDRRQNAARAAIVAGVTTMAVTAGVTVAGTGAGPFGISSPDSSGSPPTGGVPTSNTATSKAPTSRAPTGDAATSRAPTGKTLAIPATLVMLHEGESGWQVSNDPRAASSVNPCQDADATLPGRTDARTLTGRGLAIEEEHSPSLVTHQLFLYADDAAAKRAFNGLSAEAAACGWSNTIPEMNPDLADAMLRLRAQDPGTYEQIKDRYWLYDAVVVLDGNALLLASSETKGAGMTSNIDDQELSRILAPICRARLVCRPELESYPASPSPGR